MKKSILFFVSLGLTVMLQAQVSKTINATAGNLSKGLTVSEKKTVKNITVTGTIDARDFRFLRDSSAFDSINLSAVTIVAYTGTKGTFDDNSNVYDANTIPTYAFNGKSQIKSIKYPKSTTAIGDYAFSYCMGLTDTIAIPTSVTTIGIGAFIYCMGLQGSLTIPLGVSIIKNDAFYYCSSLSGLTIPQSTTYVGIAAFTNCTGLTGSLLLPNVTYLGDSAFMQCSFTDVTIKSPLTKIGGNVFSMSTLKHIVLPNTLDTIGSSAFSSTNIDSITIPASVKYVGSYAFGDCASLQQITVLNPVPVSGSSMSSIVFENVPTSSCVLFVPAGSKSAYKTADQWKNFTILEGTAALYLPSTVKDTMVLSQSGKQTFAIKAKGTWHASSNQSWLTVSPADGNGNDSITVTATNLKSNTIRNATINITSAGQPALKVFFAQDSVATSVATINNIDAVYPNPATTILHCNAAMGSLVRIYSIEGKELIAQQISADGSIAIDALPNGLYYIEIQSTDKQTIVQKFAKQ